MSATKKFLDELRQQLRNHPSGEVDDFIEYYDELIAERIASGEAESAVLDTIGTPKSVAASFRKDTAINRAVRKPTISNGMKALIAVLSVLSLPLLIPAVAMVGVFLVVVCVLIVTGLIVLLSGAIASVLAVADMASIVFAGEASPYLLFLVTGVALIVLALTFELIRAAIKAAQHIIRYLIFRLKAWHARRQQLNQEEE